MCNSSTSPFMFSSWSQQLLNFQMHFSSCVDVLCWVNRRWNVLHLDTIHFYLSLCHIPQVIHLIIFLQIFKAPTNISTVQNLETGPNTTLKKYNIQLNRLMPTTGSFFINDKINKTKLNGNFLWWRTTVYL